MAGRSSEILAPCLSRGVLDRRVFAYVAAGHRSGCDINFLEFRTEIIEVDTLTSARAELVLAAALAGRQGPLDGVSVNFADAKQTLIDARYGIAMGMGGKLLIHPLQVTPARKAYAPSDADIKRAHDILGRSEEGVIALGGMMVDAPVISWAKRIVEAAAATNVK